MVSVLSPFWSLWHFFHPPCHRVGENNKVVPIPGEEGGPWTSFCPRTIVDALWDLSMKKSNHRIQSKLCNSYIVCSKHSVMSSVSAPSEEWGLEFSYGKSCWGHGGSLLRLGVYPPEQECLFVQCDPLFLTGCLYEGRPFVGVAWSSVTQKNICSVKRLHVYLSLILHAVRLVSVIGPLQWLTRYDHLKFQTGCKKPFSHVSREGLYLWPANISSTK